MKKINKKGFTIVEVLVVMAILGVVLTAGTSVFISTISTSNKTQAQINVKEAGRNASEQITRKIQAARGLAQVSSTQVTVIDGDGVSSTLTCINGTVATNGRLEITNAGLATGLTFYDPADNTKGVNITGCDFQVVNGASGKEPPALQYTFNVSQPVGAPTRPEYQASIKIESSVVSRTYEF
ncbi:prepilin-type N-terminal cleavage/methylation domain-containing protein [Candidatus Curtissbacteria bacterium]|nr:prepilin-type N-terminal cleavage/methylation domain-containing protein [Candidatus Curtissbacteria bacterium]